MPEIGKSIVCDHGLGGRVDGNSTPESNAEHAPYFSRGRL